MSDDNEAILEQLNLKNERARANAYTLRLKDLDTGLSTIVDAIGEAQLEGDVAQINVLFTKIGVWLNYEGCPVSLEDLRLEATMLNADGTVWVGEEALTIRYTLLKNLYSWVTTTGIREKMIAWVAEQEQNESATK